MGHRRLISSTCIFILLILALASTSFSHRLIPPPPRPTAASALISNNTDHSTLMISEFRTINRRNLVECPVASPYLQIRTGMGSRKIADEENITVTVTGVLNPSEDDWLAMLSPSHSNVEDCPLNAIMYQQTGDFSHLPLLCHYPVKAAYLKNDPDYLSCRKTECSRKQTDGSCAVKTCGGSVTFHVINIRTDIEFVLFTGGFDTPCILKRTQPLQFANPNKPLYGHLSSIDSTATSMRLTWISGSKDAQEVRYGDGKSVASTPTTFSKTDMCGGEGGGGGLSIESPAKDFGWHDPGYIHTAVMTGLHPSSTASFKYGSDLVGWSDEIQFMTPPSGGSDQSVRILAFGDMGKAPRDSSIEHYIQPGSLSVSKAIADEVLASAGNVDAIFHIGDISYATGFLAEWDYFLHLINPAASRVSYMTAIGNHERDYMHSAGSVYQTPDSGGECGAPYEAYFPMPTVGKDKPWYSIEMGSIHFTVISTEHDWKPRSEQYNWIKSDLASVNRSRTPWLIITGHRPMYTSCEGGFLSSDPLFASSVEPILLKNKVDLALFGHVHNYERTCAIYRGKCKALPVRGTSGVHTLDNNNYKAPVQIVMGMAGFNLDKFSPIVHNWSLSRISKYGYTRLHASRNELNLEFVNSDTRQVEDAFQIIKNQS